jgi:hypothetical protein
MLFSQIGTYIPDLQKRAELVSKLRFVPRSDVLSYSKFWEMEVLLSMISSLPRGADSTFPLSCRVLPKQPEQHSSYT